MEVLTISRIVYVFFLSNIQTILKINVDNVRFDADIRIQLEKDASYVVQVRCINNKLFSRHSVMFLVYMFLTI